MTQISTKLRVTTLAVLFTFCSMMMASSGAFAAPAPPPAAKADPAATTLIQAVDAAGNSFLGVLKITSFTTSGNQILANGTISGTLTTAAGVTSTVSSAVTGLPLINATASCPILSLTLGPLNLNVLGLNVTLNQVVLNITAVPGAGNLLGNLLCDVANLLNGGNLSGLLTTLTTDLNSILAALGL